LFNFLNNCFVSFADMCLFISVSQLSSAEYAQVNMAMPSGWDQNVPDRQLKWQRLPLNNKPFEMKLKNGLVSNAIS